MLYNPFPLLWQKKRQLGVMRLPCLLQLKGHRNVIDSLPSASRQVPLILLALDIAKRKCWRQFWNRFTEFGIIWQILESELPILYLSGS